MVCRNFDHVREFMGGTRSKAAIKSYYNKSRKRLKLDQLVRARGQAAGSYSELEDMAAPPSSAPHGPSGAASPDDMGPSLHTSERLPDLSPEHEGGTSVVHTVCFSIVHTPPSS